MKKMIPLVVLICLISLIAVCNPKKEASKRTLVENAQCAKFEYAKEAEGGYKVITSEITILTHTFDDLILVKDASNFSGDWIYRITYNWNGICVNAKEIVVLVNEDSISIDGVNYTTEEGTDFSNIFEWVKNKYDHFNYELQYN